MVTSASPGAAAVTVTMPPPVDADAADALFDEAEYCRPYPSAAVNSMLGSISAISPGLNFSSSPAPAAKAA